MFLSPHVLMSHVTVSACLNRNELSYLEGDLIAAGREHSGGRRFACVYDQFLLVLVVSAATTAKMS